MFGLRIGRLGAVARAVRELFSPAKLFTFGEPGVWYDPSDIKLDWRYNLLTRTEEFDNAAWAKTAVLVTPNGVTAPDGSSNADVIIPNTSLADHRVEQAPSLAAGNHVLTVYAKYAGHYLGLVINGNGRIFDLQAGTSTAAVNSGASSFSIDAVGNGWFRCSITQTLTAGTNYPAIISTASASSTSSTGNGTSGIYLWGAQLEVGSTASTYQRITDGVQDYFTYQPQPVLYQDSAGTTPVTAVEQPVGLILDKSKGLVLGPELVTNGDFSSGTTGWTASGATQAIVNGEIELTATSAFFNTTQQIATIAGRYYAFSARIYRKQNRGDVRITVMSVIDGAPVTSTTPTNVTIIFRATSSIHTISANGFNGVSGDKFAFDNISVRELPGNHATQTTSTSRPVLSARYNLLTKTEQFDDAAWVKDSVTATGGILTASSSGTYRAVRQQYGTVNGTFKYSVRIKAGTSSWVNLAIGDRATAGVDNYFDVQLGVVGSSTKIGSGFDVSAPLEILPADEDGYFLCTVTFTTSLSKAVWLYVCVVDNNGSSSVTAGKTLLVKNASLVPANQASLPYQRVNTSTDYDADPSKFKPYLRFDGVDDWLVTPTITPGTDKAQVFAGVRKLSDAATGILAEFGLSPSSQGSFYLVNEPTSTRYGFAPRGARSAQANDQASVNGFSSPDTAVLTALSDLNNGTPARLKRNTDAFQNSVNTTFGGGNFLAYPLYIGRRAGTSLPFNGHLYGLIVRFGANLPTDTIASTETWLNQRTGAY